MGSPHRRRGGAAKTGLASLQVLAVSSDGARLVLAAGSDGLIQVWDLQSREPYLYLRGHANRIHSLALGWGGAFLASISDDETVWVWDLVAGEGIRRIPFLFFLFGFRRLKLERNVPAVTFLGAAAGKGSWHLNHPKIGTFILFPEIGTPSR